MFVFMRLENSLESKGGCQGALGHSEHRSYSNADSLLLPPFLLRMDETQYRYNQESL